MGFVVNGHAKRAEVLGACLLDGVACVLQSVASFVNINVVGLVVCQHQQQAVAFGALCQPPRCVAYGAPMRV